MDQANFDRERGVKLLTLMERIRAFEENAVLAAERDKLVLGAIHPSFGQAVAAGVMLPLRTDDYLISTHRGHGHTLAKEQNPIAMMRELLGREGGCCGGKGGSMHIADFNVNMLGANGVVGANITIGAGAAHGVKLKAATKLSSIFLATERPTEDRFWKDLTGLSFQLPVLFICEDNQYAAATETASVTGGDGPAARAVLWPTDADIRRQCVEAIADAVTETVARIRNGGNPNFCMSPPTVRKVIRPLI